MLPSLIRFLSEHFIPSEPNWSPSKLFWFRAETTFRYLSDCETVSLQRNISSVSGVCGTKQTCVAHMYTDQHMLQRYHKLQGSSYWDMLLLQVRNTSVIGRIAWANTASAVRRLQTDVSLPRDKCPIPTPAPMVGVPANTLGQIHVRGCEAWPLGSNLS